MSKAYKCDRCGTLFEKYSRPFWIESDLRPNVKLDICDSCKFEFEHWFDPTKYEEYEESDKSCHSCMYGNCSPSEYPCENCDNYSNYIDESWSKRCGNCANNACPVSDEPCSDCIGQDDHPNYIIKTRR